MDFSLANFTRIIGVSSYGEREHALKLGLPIPMGMGASVRLWAELTRFLNLQQFREMCGIIVLFGQYIEP